MDFSIYYSIFTVLKYLWFFSSVCVFLNVKTIYAVFGLILSFIFGSFLSIIGGATFVGFILVVVYVGAVLVFFLFVSMMIDIRHSAKFNYVVFYYFLFTILVFLFSEIVIISCVESFNDFGFVSYFGYQPNSVVIGYILYTWYIVPFIVCAFVLFVAMLGAIVLLLKETIDLSGLSEQTIFKIHGTHRQDIGLQVDRQESNAFALSRSTVYYNNVHLKHLGLPK